MKNKTAVIVFAVVIALVGVIGLTLFLISSPQDTRSRADNTEQLIIPTQAPLAQQAQTCPAPGQVQNVLVEFPNCTGDVCNFTEASCTWGALAGATKYNVAITEAETNTNTKTEEVDASANRMTFPVNANKTYKCDVSAINSCGTSGVAGSHSLFCAVDALVEATPIPTVIPKVACGQPCTTPDSCDTGLTCAIGTSGQGYCAVPAFENTCKTTPSVDACCNAPTAPPTVPPTIPPAGGIATTLAIGTGIILFIAVGAVLLIF